MPGFEYTFVCDVSAEFLCPVCNCAMRDPVQTKCGHRFCKQCLEQSMKRTPECPVDRRPLNQKRKGDIYLDVAIKRTILDLKVKCPNGKTGCQWIGELRKAQSHIEFCEKYPCCCPQKCGKNNIPREKLESHIETNCSLTKVDCTYAHVGCKEKVARRALPRHLKDKTEIHLSLACDMVHELEQQVKEIKQHVKPKLIWKFDNFARRRDLAKFGGKKFYTSPTLSFGPQGYQMEILVYPNGDGQGECTDLSIYSSIVQGEYDAILPWPFTLDVTFTLIDQQADPQERQNIQAILVATKSNHLPRNTFTRPTAQPNPAVGFTKFVSQETIQTRRYLVDDTLVFQVEGDLLDSVI